MARISQWMLVSTDGLETPLFTANTAEELAEYCGTTASSIRSSISYVEKGKTKKSRYRRVFIDTDEPRRYRHRKEQSFWVCGDQVSESADDLAKKTGVTEGHIRQQVSRFDHGDNTTYKRIKAEVDMKNEVKDKAVYCDRCSAKMPNGTEALVTVSIDHLKDKRYRLCKECAIQARLFFEGDI